MADILIRSPAVQARTGLPKSTLHNLARAGGFPRPVKLGIRSVAWRASDVDAWIESRQQLDAGNEGVNTDPQVVGPDTSKDVPLRAAVAARSFQPDVEK